MWWCTVGDHHTFMATEISHVLINRSAGLILCGYDYNTFNFK